MVGSVARAKGEEASHALAVDNEDGGWKRTEDVVVEGCWS